MPFEGPFIACYNSRMHRTPILRLFLLILTLMALFAPQASVLAQFEAIISINSLATDEFPSLSIYVSVSDENGRIISGLPATSFRVIEDGIQLPNLDLEEVLTGTRQVFVINTSTGLSRRSETGTLFYEQIHQALLDWWQSPESTQYGTDNLTLITTDGSLASHVPLAAQLAAALDLTEPTYDETLSDLDLLLHGLAAIADPSPMPGMPRHLIFISPLIESPGDIQVTNAIALARESNTAIHTVLVGSAEAAWMPGGDAMRRMSQQTGGSYSFFDPEAGLGELAALLAQQRQLYRLTANSLVYRSGEHTIEVQVSEETLEGASEPVTYRIELQPPEVAFVEPPIAISRQPEDPDQPIDTLSPSSRDLTLLVTFPDGHPRPLVESWLVADGVVVARQSEAPFEQIPWDLSDILANRTLTLQAGVQDSLGLEGISVQIQIRVEVPPPPQGLEALKPALTWLLAALGVLIVGVLLAVALISTSRQQPAPRPMDKQTTSPVDVRLRQAVYPRRPMHQIAEAFLIPLGPQGQEGQPIPITGAVLTLGRSASLVSAPVDDPSIAALHARLIRRAGGEHVIRDQGSIAGTWVNHQPIPEDGRVLKHGDLVHLGRIAFRFRMRVPPAEHEVRITPTDQNGRPLEEGNQEAED
ncbi:MAG: FHA domain-containing protein [Anaerolineales bacterium]